MGTTLQQHYTSSYETGSVKTSAWRRFINWCDEQEKSRFGWVAVSMTLHGCIITIFTAFAIILSGNHFIFWPFAIAAMGITLVVNLAAMPTKIIIPAFFFSILIDLGVIISCALMGFDFSNTVV